MKGYSSVYTDVWCWPTQGGSPLGWWKEIKSWLPLLAPEVQYIYIFFSPLLGLIVRAPFPRDSEYYM